MFQNKQKVVVVSSGDPARVIKVQSASGTPDPSRYPIVDTTGVTGRDQQVQIVSGGDATRFPILRGVSDARGTADSVISALTPAAWYRNATGVTSSGGFASQWDDYSGNTRHLVQATGTNQPAYSAGVFTFDGADNFMKVTGGFTFNQPVTIYFVGQQVSWTGNDTFFDGNSANTGIIYQTGVTPTIVLYAGANAANTTNLAVATDGVVCAVFNGASSSLRINNNAKTTGNPGAGNMGGFTLGALATPGLHSNTKFEEVILFTGAHTDTEQSNVITALNNALTVF